MIKANPYSLFQQNLPKGIIVTEGQKKSKIAKTDSLVEMRRIREEKVEEVEDPDLTKCKQRLKESLIKKR